MHARKVCLGLLMAACGGITAAAQAPANLSLNDAIARALEANQTIVAARTARNIDVAGVQAAGQRPNPEVNVENERETPRWAFGGTIPIEISGKRGRRIDVANATLAVTEAETARITADVRADVRRAYYAAVAAARRVQVAQDLEQIATRARNATQERFQAGAAPRLDALQAQLALSEVQNQSAAAQGELQAARTELNTLLAYPPDAAPVLSDGLETGPLPTVQEASREALAGNAELRVLESLVAEAKARVELAKAMRRPDPSVSASVTWDAQPEFGTGWRFGGNIALPIFATGRPDVAVAEATLARSVADRDARAAQITGAVAANVARAIAARQAVERYQNDVLPGLQQVEAMAQESYSSGQTGLPALLQMLQAGRELRQRALQAGLDYQMALAELERAMGTPVK